MANEEDNLQRRDKIYFENMSAQEQQDWTRGIVTRMMLAYGVHEKKALALRLGCHQNMPSNWIQAGAVPWKVVFVCHVDTNKSLDWLYTGKAPQVVISYQLERELLTIAEDLLNLGERMSLITPTVPNGFNSVAKSMVKELTAHMKGAKKDIKG